MNPTTHEQVREIFLEARELAPEQRAHFLAQACGGNDALQAEVDSLLGLESEAHSFLAVPALGARVEIDLEKLGEDAAGPDLAGTRVGHFEILDLIAAGGMGVVYRARQDHPKRDVALKIMRAGLTSAEARRRFDLEVEILGRLRHPGIASIYEAGRLARGGSEIPYFVMEFIPGARLLIDFADGENLDRRQRLELFSQVCDAVQHGHQRGIVHRDLKPDNMLVDQTGQPKIIDFGIARSTNVDLALTTMHTSMGELVGTIQYMSPEQCEGDPREIDTRTDVYSLGVILYELICGRPPYDVSGRSAIGAMRLVHEEPVPSPRQIRRDVRRDLDRVMLKALERDRGRRYQSAAELAADIRRYLRGEPVSAIAPGVWMRAFHWASRHPIQATAAACVLLGATTVASTYVAVWWLARTPFGVALAPDKSEAWITARNGNILHRFDGGGPNGIRFADRFQWRDSDETWLAAIGFQGRRSNQYSGRLIVVDPNHPDEPLWSSPLNAAQFKPPHQGVNGPTDVFHVQQCIAAEVFPQSPGQELIATFHHYKSSPGALRIYSSGGEVLFQAWNDGTIGDVRWMSEWGQLLLLAINNRVWPEDIGENEFPAYKHPLALLTVEPVYGVLHSTWIASADTNAPSKAGFFKVLAPSELWMSFRNGNLWASARSPGNADIDYRYLSGQEQTAVTITINREGGVLSRWAGDGYDDDEGPDLELLHFVDLVDFDPNTRPRTYD